MTTLKASKKKEVRIFFGGLLVKKFILSCSIVLLGLGLSGCDNQNHKENKQSKIKSGKVSSLKRSSSFVKSSSLSSSTSSIQSAKNQQPNQNLDTNQQLNTQQQPTQQNSQQPRQNIQQNNQQSHMENYEHEKNNGLNNKDIKILDLLQHEWSMPLIV